jgi:mono/diheme cytochrome c family protein
MKPTLNPKKTTGAAAALFLAVVGGLLLTSCLQPADEIAGKNAGRLVFVKEPSVGNRDGNIAMAANPNEFYPGTDLYMLSPISPSGDLTNLTKEWTRGAADHDRWGAAQDPEVSFDGERIVFSMRKANANSWLIYELNLGSGNLTQLTDIPTECVTAQAERECNDIDPAYIDDTHIVFGSTRNRVEDEYERRLVPQLFTGELGGPDGRLKNVRQITFNQSHDQNPFLHSSGKIYYARWDHLGDPNKIPLFTVDPDGTKQFVLYGADETFSGAQGMGSGQRAFLEARELADGGIVTSLMERTSRFEGGAIAIVDISNFSAPPRIITPGSSPYNNTEHPSEALFKTPYPVFDGGKERLIVAKSARESGAGIPDPQVNFDLFVMDKDGSNMQLIHADPNYNDYDPVVVEPRRLPYPRQMRFDPNVRKALDANAKTGRFFDANVYSRQNDNHIKPDPTFVNSDGSVGQAKYLRVLEAVPMPDYGMRGGALGQTEFEKQKLVGYADVSGDGSFSIEVPANRPMHLQTLDENGMMLVNQLQWINVMPGERRMCTGCHGPRDHDIDIKGYDIRNDSVVDTLHFDAQNNARRFIATFANAQSVTAHPSAHDDTVDFYDLRNYSSHQALRTNTVQAVLDRNCNSCHGAAVAAAQGGRLVLENAPDDSLNGKEGITSVYKTLSDKGGYATAKAGTSMAYATSDGARNSPLAWVMFNKQLGDRNETLFRAPSYDHSALWEKDAHGHINPFAAKNADLLRLIEWMDMGLQFSNSVGWSYEK